MSTDWPNAKRLADILASNCFLVPSLPGLEWDSWLLCLPGKSVFPSRLTCTSSGKLTSARVAVALKKKGDSNVWVLEGGLTAWKREGFPVTLHLSTSNETAGRFGIRVIEYRSEARQRSYHRFTAYPTPNRKRKADGGHSHLRLLIHTRLRSANRMTDRQCIGTL